MKENKDFTEQDVIAYYDLNEAQYKMNWKLDKCLALHYGFKDELNKSFEESLINMNAQLAKRAKISKEDYILDAGCGVGGSSIYLAKHFNCRAHGITLSAKQVISATNYAKKFSLEDKVSFSEQNYTKTNFVDNTFDVVWAVESVCQAIDKADFYNEAYRILKPGGRLIVADYVETDNIGAEGKLALKKWLDRWAIKYIPTVSMLEKYLNKFNSFNIENVTKNMITSSRYMYRMYYLGYLFHHFYRIFFKMAPESEANFESAKYQYLSLKKNYWSYRIITAIK